MTKSLPTSTTKTTPPRTARRPAPARRTAPRATPRGGARGGPAERPAARPSRAPARPPHRERAPRAPFVLLVLGLLGGGLVSLLLLNIVLAKDSYRVNDLINSTRQLREQAEAIENRNRIWEQPHMVAEQGERYGLEFDKGAPRFISPAPPEDTGR